MKRGTRILVLLLVAAVLVWVELEELSPHEPSYSGRSLTSWLRQLDDGDTSTGLSWQTWTVSRSDQQARAANAIRRMGTNSVPYLLEALTNRDSNMKTKILALLAKQHWIKFPPPGTNHMHRAAALAFDVLGPTAKAAVPNLVGILNRPPHPDDGLEKNAAIALAAIDPEGREVLMPLVSSNGWAGACAIWGLASHRARVPPEVIQSLISNVTKNPGGNGSLSAWALGELQQDATHSIPALINGFNSTDVGTRWGSAYGLEAWGARATSAIPVLSAGLKDPDSTIRSYAKRALDKIDPQGDHREGDRK